MNAWLHLLEDLAHVDAVLLLGIALFFEIVLPKEKR